MNNIGIITLWLVCVGLGWVIYQGLSFFCDKKDMFVNRGGSRISGKGVHMFKWVGVLFYVLLYWAALSHFS